MDRFIPFGKHELLSSNKYYGGRDIFGKLLPADTHVEPETVSLTQVKNAREEEKP